MKTTKRIAALLLVLVLALSLVACGNQEEKKLLGTWQTELDLTEALSEALSGSSGIDAAYLPTDTTVSITLTLTFAEKQACTIAVALDKDAFNAYIASLSDGVIEMLYQSGEEAGVDRETFDSVFATQYGMDVKSYVDTMLEGYDADTLLDEVESTEDGYWKVEDGKLYFSDEKDFSGDDIDETTYHFDGETLIFDSITTEDDSFSQLEELGLELPWSFTKK